MNNLPIKDSYKPAEAAKWLDVSTNTIRNWCIQYDEFLSEDATPDKGSARKFTQRDMNIFKIINDGVSRKDNHNEIAQSLIDMGDKIPKEIQPSKDTPESSPDAQDGPQTALAPAIDLDALAPLLAAITANQASAEQLQVLADATKANAEQMQTLADANQIKAERIAIVEDRTKSQAGQMQQQQYLMYGILIAVLLVLIMMVVLVMVLR
jgi:hypothetical protein